MTGLLIVNVQDEQGQHKVVLQTNTLPVEDIIVKSIISTSVIIST